MKLPEQLMKIVERIFDESLSEIVEIDEKQFDCLNCRGTVTAIFTVRQLQETRLKGTNRTKLIHRFGKGV